MQVQGAQGAQVQSGLGQAAQAQQGAQGAQVQSGQGQAAQAQGAQGAQAQGEQGQAARGQDKQEQAHKLHNKSTSTCGVIPPAR